MDLLTAPPLPPLTLLFLLAMCFLAGFVDAVAGGGGLISLPAFLTSCSQPERSTSRSHFPRPCSA